MTLGFPTILIPAVKEPAPGEVLHLEMYEIAWISKSTIQIQSNRFKIVCLRSLGLPCYSR